MEKQGQDGKPVDAASLLKRADRLIRDGHLTEALELVVIARTSEPRNLYALAYEERVRALIAMHVGRESEAAVSPRQPVVEKKAEPEPKLTYLSELAAVESKEEAKSVGITLPSAAQEPPVTQPKHDIPPPRAETQPSSQPSQMSAAPKPASDPVKPPEPETTKGASAPEGSPAQVDHAVLHCLQRVKRLYQMNRIEEALSELAYAIILDPLHPEVLSLEERIIETQESEQRRQILVFQKQLAERQKRRKAIIAAIQVLSRQREEMALNTSPRPADGSGADRDALEDVERRILAAETALLASSGS